MWSELSHRAQSNSDQIRPGEKNTQRFVSHSNTLLTVCRQIQERFKTLANRPGVHTSSYIAAAGFQYTGNRDTARCNDCGLEVSNWTEDMNPFTIHSERNPYCEFIRSLKPSSSSDGLSSSSSTIAFRNTSTSNGKENLAKRQKIETTDLESQTNTSIEADSIQQMRKRTFSHWPHHTSPSSAQMDKAGFSNCNVGDRVICIYCNLICQQWTPHVDDPCEVHRTISPDCKYVKEKLINREPPRIVNPNESSTRITASSHSLRFSEVLRPTAQNDGNRGVQKPVTVSSTTPNAKIPPIDDMILGGFFNTNTKAVEECSYCNKSLQNLDSNADPMIKHAQWLLHCAHTGQEDDNEFYHKTERFKQTKQERDQGNKLKQTTDSGVMFSNNSIRNSRQLSLRDKRIVSRLIAAEFDLPISLRSASRSSCNLPQIKHDDSTFDIDLLFTCAIVQKQIDHIDGKEENIIRSGEIMCKIIEQNKKNQTEELAQKQTSSMSVTTNNQGETTMIKQPVDVINDKDQFSNLTPSNPCVLCLTEEKRLACLPCGHLAICVSCGNSLRSCPICRRNVNAFVQIYT